MEEQDLAGMTVSERLFALGLMEDFDRAASNRDRGVLIAVLLKARFSRKEAEETSDALLAKPQKYGF